MHDATEIRKCQSDTPVEDSQQKKPPVAPETPRNWD